MMKFIEKVGNIQVFVRENAPADISVFFYNGKDCILQETFFTNDQNAAIERLFLQCDIVTLHWIYQNIPADRITRLSLNTCKMDAQDYFCRIDDTRYFATTASPPMNLFGTKTGKESSTDNRTRSHPFRGGQKGQSNV